MAQTSTLSRRVLGTVVGLCVVVSSSGPVCPGVLAASDPPSTAAAEMSIRGYRIARLREMRTALRWGANAAVPNNAPSIIDAYNASIAEIGDDNPFEKWTAKTWGPLVAALAAGRDDVEFIEAMTFRMVPGPAALGGRLEQGPAIPKLGSYGYLPDVLWLQAKRMQGKKGASDADLQWSHAAARAAILLDLTMPLPTTECNAMRFARDKNFAQLCGLPEDRARRVLELIADGRTPGASDVQRRVMIPTIRAAKLFARQRDRNSAEAFVKLWLTAWKADAGVPGIDCADRMFTLAGLLSELRGFFKDDLERDVLDPALLDASRATHVAEYREWLDFASHQMTPTSGEPGPTLIEREEDLNKLAGGGK
jgi:hypothetical protein